MGMKRIVHGKQQSAHVIQRVSQAGQVADLTPDGDALIQLLLRLIMISQRCLDEPQSVEGIGHGKPVAYFFTQPQPLLEEVLRFGVGAAGTGGGPQKNEGVGRGPVIAHRPAYFQAFTQQGVGILIGSPIVVQNSQLAQADRNTPAVPVLTHDLQRFIEEMAAVGIFSHGGRHHAQEGQRIR